MTGQPLLPHDEHDSTHADECDFCQENLAAFTLGTLDRFDQGLVEHHLRWCEQCRADAALHEQVVDQLGLIAPDVGDPSPSLWQTIANRLDDPADTPIPTGVPIVTMVPSAPVAPSTGTPSWTRFLPASFIAPLVLAIVILGAWGWSLQDDLSDREAELANRSLLNSTLVESQQVQLFSVERTCPNCEGVGQVGVSESNAMGMLVGWDFDPHVQHDVWGIDHQGERSRVCQLIIESNGEVMQMFTFPDSPSKFTDLYITDQHGQVVYVSHIVTDEAPGIQPATPGLPITWAPAQVE